MPGTVQQELTRILGNMRAQGRDRIWLNPDNVISLQTPAGRFPGDTMSSPVRQEDEASFPKTAVPVAPAASTHSTAAAVAQPRAMESPSQPVQPPIAAQPVQAVPGIQQRPFPPSFTHQQATPSPPVAPVPKSIPPHWEEGLKTASMAELAGVVSRCGSCSLGACRRYHFFMAGQVPARVVFVGDYPTAEEDAQGAPFAGAAGQMLFKMGQAMGLHWDTSVPERAVAYVTVLKCRPSSPPPPELIQACLPILYRQLELLHPDALVLMGQCAVKSLTNSTEGFSKVKGTWLSYKGIPAVAIQHPVQMMRLATLPDAFKKERIDAWNTLQDLMKLLKLVVAK